MACGQQGGEWVEGWPGRWVKVGGVVFFQGSQWPESFARSLPLWVGLLPSSFHQVLYNSFAFVCVTHWGSLRFVPSKGPIAKHKSGHQ